MLTMNLTVKEIRLHNLLGLIEKSGLSKGAFAAKIETSPAYISQIISKKTKRGMGDFVARKMELALRKPKGWMDSLHAAEDYAIETAETVKIKPDAEWLGDFDTWDDDTPLGEDEVTLIFYKEVELAAGLGRTEVVEYPQYKLRFAKSTLKKMGVDESAAYCVTVSGNSMEPVLPDGATLGIDTGKTAIKDGDIYAIDHAGSLRVKILYRMPGGGLRLRSYNSEEWPDEHLGPEEAEKIRVLGRVFWCSFLR